MRKLGRSKEPPAEEKAPSKVLPALAGLGVSAVTAPLLYKHLRKFRPSSHAGLRSIQEKSQGRMARTVMSEDPGTPFKRWLDRMKFDVDELHYLPDGTKAPKKPKKFEGAVHHFTPEDAQFVRGTANPMATPEMQEIMERMGDHKWKEYEAFSKAAPRAMPKSENIQAILKQMGVTKIPRAPAKREALLSDLQGELKKRYGTGFVMKDVEGVQSSGAFPSEKHDFNQLLKDYRTSGIPERTRALNQQKNVPGDAWDKYYKEMQQNPAYSGRVLEDLLKSPESVMVQKKVNIEAPTGIRRMVGKALGKPASKEVRVHVIGGKAVPELTLPRFDPTMAIFERQKMRDAAAFAQSTIDKMPKKYQQAHFGMDVAPIEGGGFKLIESNPGGQSGLLEPEMGGPFISPKLYRHMTGAWSPRVSAMGAGAGGIAAGGAAYGAGRALQPSPKKEQQLQPGMVPGPQPPIKQPALAPNIA